MRHNAEDRVTTSTMNKWGGSARLIFQDGRQDRLHLGPDAKIESAAIEGHRPMGSRRHGSEPWIDLVDGTDYSCSLLGFGGRDDPLGVGPAYIRLSPSLIVYEIAELDDWLDARAVTAKGKPL